MELKPKVTLKQKGEKAAIPIQNIHVKMIWKAAVDLDLHAYYRIIPGQEPEKTGMLSKMFGSGKEKSEGHVFFSSMGSKKKFPWIALDQDAGIGDQGGDNEENLHFIDLKLMQHVLIVANIYNKPNANFASFDGRVVLMADNREIEVPLSASKPGSYCIIAHVDLSGGQPMLINVNKTQTDEPSIETFLRGG
ncbi:MAG: hypothetical protein GY862_07875 [Gammaproteobacteria bacterium]|nr:hypothetical protein [Gammaproteobacteria bacterium]